MRAYLFTLLMLVLSFMAFAEDSLLVYAGSASQPAAEEVGKLFEKEYGVRVNYIFGGSGYVLSQMIISRQGDVYFPGSSDYMELAKSKGVVFPETERLVVYLVPAIVVQKGNPRNIKDLRDLLRPDVSVAIADPESVCVGLYAVEIVEKAFNEREIQRFREKLVNYTGSCAKTAAAISLKQVDAVIGWRVFEKWDPGRVEAIPLAPEQVQRIGYIPAAVSVFTKSRELAELFVGFLASEKSRKIFRKYGYFTTPEEAFEYVGSVKPIGGVYKTNIEEWTGEK